MIEAAAMKSLTDHDAADELVHRYRYLVKTREALKAHFDVLLDRKTAMLTLVGATKENKDHKTVIHFDEVTVVPILGALNGALLGEIESARAVLERTHGIETPSP